MSLVQPLGRQRERGIQVERRGYGRGAAISISGGQSYRRPWIEQIVSTRGRNNRGGARCVVQRSARRVRIVSWTVRFGQNDPPQPNFDLNPAEQRPNPHRHTTPYPP